MTRRGTWLALICVACGGAAPREEPPVQAPPRVASVTMPALRIMSPFNPLTHELRFARNAVEPLPSDASTLEEIVKDLGDQRLTLVVVSGHAEPDETPGVADARARRIVELLVARGIERARLETRPPTDLAPRERGGRCGTGSASASSEEDERDRAENRWVRFRIVRTTDD